MWFLLDLFLFTFALFECENTVFRFCQFNFVETRKRHIKQVVVKLTFVPEMK